MTSLQQKFQNTPQLGAIVDALLGLWPEHLAYCESRFRDDGTDFLARAEEMAGLAKKLAGGQLEQYLTDYRWMCEEFLVEEIYFRRHGTYRRASFQEAYDAIYSDPEYMARYVRGILISQLIWRPHALAFDHFRTDFLPRLPGESRYLEVGPGHGLFLYFASLCEQIADIVAWDVSQSSIAASRNAIECLGVRKPVELFEQDVLQAPAEPATFDAAVISEVLEHLEQPGTALRTLFESLKPGGHIFVNAPVNSPAPDHIFLWRTTDEFMDLVKSVGFEVVDANFFPVTGASLERALKQDLSISCVMIAQKPDS